MHAREIRRATEEVRSHYSGQFRLRVGAELHAKLAKVADRHGMKFYRSATSGTHPTFIGMLADCVLEGMGRGPITEET